MTRKEERIEASIDYQMSTNPIALGGAAYEDMIRKMNVNHSFVAGAEWADKTMLDKVYDFIIANAYKYGKVKFVDNKATFDFRTNTFLNDLKQVIEE